MLDVLYCAVFDMGMSMCRDWFDTSNTTEALLRRDLARERARAASTQEKLDKMIALYHRTRSELLTAKVRYTEGLAHSLCG